MKEYQKDMLDSLQSYHDTVARIGDSKGDGRMCWQHERQSGQGCAVQQDCKEWFAYLYFVELVVICSWVISFWCVHHIVGVVFHRSASFHCFFQCVDGVATEG